MVPLPLGLPSGAVEFFAFLDLGQKKTFFKGLLESRTRVVRAFAGIGCGDDPGLKKDLRYECYPSRLWNG